MDSRTPNGRRPLAGLILVVAALGCGGGRRAAPVTASTPGGAETASAIDLPADAAFERAISRGTRTKRGEPGPKYWQQWTDYRLEAELNPISKRLTGAGNADLPQPLARHASGGVRPTAAQPLRPGRAA